MTASQASPFPRPFEIVAPSAWTVPAVINSPHSGRFYPKTFLAASRLSPPALRKSEDCYIDELFGSGPDFGAPLLKAHFPRAYLDVNREPYELDPRMFCEPMPGYANTTSVRVAGGLGTIPRIVCEGEDIYRAPLGLAEALGRIETLYRPYHRALADLMDQVAASFGSVFVLDCHSMPSSAAGPPGARVDVVLGDRHGAACADELTSLAEDLLKAQGLKVVRNKPYAGGFITQNYGAPGAGRHVLQIEINRALYLDEHSVEKTRGFAALAAMTRTVLAELLTSLDDLMSPVRAAAE